MYTLILLPVAIKSVKIWDVHCLGKRRGPQTLYILQHPFFKGSEGDMGLICRTICSTLRSSQCRYEICQRKHCVPPRRDSGTGDDQLILPDWPVLVGRAPFLLRCRQEANVGNGRIKDPRDCMRCW